MPRGREPLPPVRPVPGVRATAGQALRLLYGEGARLGWAALLELVVVGMVWTLGMLVGWGALISSLVRGGSLVVAYLLPPLPLAGPATVGLYAAVDAIWSGESVGPFDALRTFGRGFGHRYLRSVGLSAVWLVIVVGAFANVLVGAKVMPAVLLGGTRLVLLYLLLFFAMASTYAVPILVTTEFDLGAVIRLAAWEAVANPLFTLGVLIVPAALVLIGAVMTPVLPALLLGGALALAATGALRYVPLRHPDLPAPYWENAPMDDADRADGEGAQVPSEDEWP